MKKSIMQNGRESYLSGRTDSLEKHHVFGGANRKWSEIYGLFVYLAHDEHNEPPRGVHHNAEKDYALKCDGQRAFERVHGTREEFMQIFGRNWLDEEPGEAADWGDMAGADLLEWGA